MMRTGNSQENLGSKSTEELAYAADSDSSSKSSTPPKLHKKTMSKESIAAIDYNDLKKRLETALADNTSREAQKAKYYLTTLNPNTSTFDQKRLLVLDELLFEKKLISTRLATLPADRNHFTWSDVITDLTRMMNPEDESWNEFAYRTLETGATMLKNAANTILNYSGSVFNQFRLQGENSIQERGLSKRVDQTDTEEDETKHTGSPKTL